jgi:hypothetical protein
MKRTLLVLLCAGCGPSVELTVDVRLPADTRGLLVATSRFDLAALRDARVIAQASFAAGTHAFPLQVENGPRTVLTLDGLDALGDVIGHGQSCEVDLTQSGLSATLYFAPTNFFSPTAGPPAIVRTDPVALALDDGTVLLAGGGDPSSERFTPGTARFASAAATLDQARSEAEVTPLPSVGALVTGGLDPSGQPLASAEIYSAGRDQFIPLGDVLGSARVGHRAVLQTDGRVLVLGGRDSSGQALATTRLLRVRADGMTATSTDGPLLTEAKSETAAVVDNGVVVVIGGFDASGAPVRTVEALGAAGFEKHADLQTARAEATASLLSDGSILVVGGVGPSGPLDTAELYNPILRTTTVLPITARHGHTATLLPDGRVLVAGGFGADGQPLDSVELYTPEAGFVTERSLTTPRAGHVAVPLCDGTVLVVGGGDGAELYTPPTS